MFEEMLDVLVPTIPGITLEQARTLARYHPHMVCGNAEIAIPWGGGLAI